MVQDWLLVVMRRWYVAVSVFLMAGAFLFLLIWDGGLYTNRTSVTFTYPGISRLTANSGIENDGIIIFARSVAAVINSDRAAIEYSSHDAPYYGGGIREGAFVGVPNDGNQWYASYSQAKVDIQIVGRNEEWVRATQGELIGEVLRTSDNQQEALNVPADSRIEVTVDPLTMTIDHISPSRLSQMLAYSAISASALIVAVWACVAVENSVVNSAWPRNRRSRLTIQTYEWERE